MQTPDSTPDRMITSATITPPEFVAPRTNPIGSTSLTAGFGGSPPLESAAFPPDTPVSQEVLQRLLLDLSNSRQHKPLSTDNSRRQQIVDWVAGFEKDNFLNAAGDSSFMSNDWARSSQIQSVTNGVGAQLASFIGINNDTVSGWASKMSTAESANILLNVSSRALFHSETVMVSDMMADMMINQKFKLLAFLAKQGWSLVLAMLRNKVAIHKQTGNTAGGHNSAVSMYRRALEIQAKINDIYHEGVIRYSPTGDSTDLFTVDEYYVLERFPRPGERTTNRSVRWKFEPLAAAYDRARKIISKFGLKDRIEQDLPAVNQMMAFAGNVASAAENVAKATEGLGDAVNGVTETLSAATDTFRGTTDLINEISPAKIAASVAKALSEQMSKLLGGLGAIFKSGWDLITKHWDAIGVILIAVLCYQIRGRVTSPIVKVMLQFLPILGVVYGLGSWSDYMKLSEDLGTGLRDFDSESENGTAVNEMNDGHTILEALSVVWIAWGLPASDKSSFVRTLAAFPSFVKGSKAFIEALYDFLGWLCHKVSKFTGWDVSWHPSFETKLQMWFDDCERVVGQSSNMPATVEYISQVRNLLYEGSKWSHVQKDSPLKSAVDKMMTALDKVYLEAVKVSNLLDGEHEQPVGLILFGGPGTGKTELARWVGKEFASIIGEHDSSVKHVVKNYPSGIMWAVPDDEEFMAGYTNYTVGVLLDDVGKETATDYETNSFGKLISWVNGNPAATPQAALQDKGKIMMNHKILVATTNRDSIQAQGIGNMSAFSRRITLCLRISNTGQNTVAEAGGEFSLERYVCEICLVDSHGKFIPTGVTMSATQIARTLASEWVTRRKYFDSALKAIQQRMTTIDKTIPRGDYVTDYLKPNSTSDDLVETVESVVAFNTNVGAPVDYKRMNISGVGIPVEVIAEALEKGASDTFKLGASVGRYKDIVQPAPPPAPKRGAKHGGFMSDEEIEECVDEISSIIGYAVPIRTVAESQGLEAETVDLVRRDYDLFSSASEPMPGSYMDSGGDVLTSNDVSLFPLMAGRMTADVANESGMIGLVEPRLTTTSPIHVALHHNNQKVGISISSGFIGAGGMTIPSDGYWWQKFAFGASAFFGMVKTDIAVANTRIMVPFVKVATTAAHVGVHATTDRIKTSVTRISWDPIGSFFRALYWIAAIPIEPNQGETIISYCAKVWDKFIRIDPSPAMKQAIADFVKRLVVSYISLRLCVTEHGRVEGFARWLALDVRPSDPYLHIPTQGLGQALLGTISIAKSVYNFGYRAITSAWEWIKDNKEVVVSIAVAIGGLWFCFGGPESTTQASGHHGGYRVRAVRRINQPAISGGSHTQGLLPLDDSILPVVQANMGEILLNGQYAGSILGIRKKQFIIMKHYLENLEHYETKDPKVVFELRFKGVTWPLNKNTYKVLHDDLTVDQAVIEMLNNMDEIRDITSHIATDAEYAKIWAKPHTMVTMLLPVNRFAVLEARGEELDRMYDNGAIEFMASRRASVTSKNGVTQVRTVRLDCLTYRLPTKKGCCGVPILVNGKIVGLHSAGLNAVEGIATKCTQTVVARALNSEGVDFSQFSVEFPDIAIDQSTISLPSKVPYNSDVHNGDVSFVYPPSSVFVSGDLREFKGRSDDFPPATKVIVNTASKLYEVPRAKQNQDYGCVIDPKIMAPTIMVMGQRLREILAKEDVRTLSLEEAILGTGDGYVKPHDVSKSPGYPYTAMGLSAKDLIDKNSYPPFTKRGQELLLPDVKDRMHCLAHGYTPMMPYTDSLKHELRAPEKVNSPRAISGANLADTLTGKMLYGGLLGALKATKTRNNTMLGINPVTDWNTLEMQFIQKGGETRHGAGDFSNWDGRITRDHIVSLWSVLEYPFGDMGYHSGTKEGMKMGELRKRWLISCVESVHVRGSVLEWWTSSWCSGNYMTAGGNSLLNELLFRYCFLTLHPDRDAKPLIILAEEFDSAVAIKTLGDDNRFAVDVGYEWFNMISISKVMSTLGMLYTDANKNLEFPEFYNLADCSLLKRKSVYHPDYKRWVGATEIDTLINMMHYASKTDILGTIYQRADNFVREMALHPREVYDHYVPLVRRWVGGSWVPPYINYDDARARVFTGDAEYFPDYN